MVPLSARMVAKGLDSMLYLHGLGIDAPCFDLNSACCTFVIQLSLLAGMDPTSMPTFILLVNPESYTHVLDYSDKRVAPLNRRR